MCKASKPMQKHILTNKLYVYKCVDILAKKMYKTVQFFTDFWLDNLLNNTSEKMLPSVFLIFSI